jgi:hypothetical protein
MEQGYGEVPDYYPQVKFDFDQDPDPAKRRTKNIKKAKKLLRPARAWLGLRPRFNEPGQCCVTGIRLAALGPDAYDKPLLDPDTLQPVEDGRTLSNHFFVDQITGSMAPFTAMSSVDSGIPLRSGYCPELLQLYWLFTQWRYSQHIDGQGQHSVWLWKNRKIKMIPVQKKKEVSSKPPLVERIEPFYQMCLENRGKGIEVTEYRNEIAGEVDLITITLDLRRMRHEQEIYEAQRISADAPSAIVGGA